MSTKNDSTKKQTITFNGAFAIGDLIGGALTNLGSDLQLRVELFANYKSATDWMFEVAFEQPRMAVGFTQQNKVSALRKWTVARQLVTGVMTGDNRIEGMERAEAMRLLQRAGVVRPSPSMTASKWTRSYEEMLEHTRGFCHAFSPQFENGKLVEALRWHASCQRNGLAKEEAIPACFETPVFMDDDEGQQRDATLAEMQEWIQDIHASEKELAILDSVPGPIMALASFGPPKLVTQDDYARLANMSSRDAEREKRSLDSSTKRLHQMMNNPGPSRMCVALHGYSERGEVRVLRVSCRDGVLRVEIGIPKVMRGGGIKLPDGMIDWSSQTIIQQAKGRPMQVNGQRFFERSLVNVPQVGEAVGEDGESIPLYIPLGNYDALKGHDPLREILKRQDLNEAVGGALLASWGHEKGAQEVTIAAIRELKGGRDFLDTAKADMLAHAAEIKQAESVAKADAFRAANPEMTVPEARQEAEAFLAAPASGADAAGFEALIAASASAVEGAIEVPMSDTPEEVTAEGVSEVPMTDEEQTEEPAESEEEADATSPEEETQEIQMPATAMVA